MSRELDDAYFRSTPCTHHEPLLSKLVDAVNMLEERIKGLLGGTIIAGDVDTLPAGSEATASATKQGYDTVLTFGIPRGEKGDKGEPGEPGAPGAPGKDGAPGKPGSDASATDVRINGTSITKDGVADIPKAGNGTLGVVGVFGQYGIAMGATNNIYVNSASNNELNTRASSYKPIVPNTLDYAVKVAMCDGKGAAWTSNERNAAKKRLGIDTTAPETRLWFSSQEPGRDIETDGEFGFKLTALVSAEGLSATDYLKEFDIILWNGYAYFAIDNDGEEAIGDTKMAFAPHTA